MNNFEFCVPTDVLFGAGMEEQLPDKLRPFGNKILLTYGGGSIKKSGLYDRLKGILKEFELFELSGIAPNPKVESVNEGAAVCKREGIDMVLAVGGGSVIDCSKLIAAAAHYDGDDAWDLVADMSKATNALPVCVVLTIAATGSEMDAAAVISKTETNEKLPFFSPHVLPKVSVLNPANTFSVPAYQTAAGASDILSHALENYFDRVEAFVPDAIGEGLMRAVIKYTPIALEKPDNYEARAQLMWASSLALNGLGSTGKTFTWSCHYIEHELSAYYDITHGAGLAMLTPKWMRYVLCDATVDKFCDYAVNVWGCDQGGDKFALANRGIDATEAFFKQIGMPTALGEFDIDETHFEAMAKSAVRVGSLGNAFVPLNEQDVVKILQMCL